MPAQARHLHAIAAGARPRRLPHRFTVRSSAQGTLGFCPSCEAVYHAALELRERLLARRGAQLQAARPALFDGMAPRPARTAARARAAQSAHRGIHASVLELAGLEDFLGELRELGLGELT